MKTLVIGDGAREHALVRKLSESTRITGLFCAPGNAGTAELARNIALDPCNPKAMALACASEGVGLVVIGPEKPLAAGLADALRKEGIAVFGPGAEAARLESSKSFARAFSDRHGIPSARTARFSSLRDFEAYIEARPGTLVLKKSGLAAGKGVFESSDRAELASFGKRILADDELLVEDFLEGYELSIFALTDGEEYCILPPCADHKKAAAGDSGPNTGGMGAVCPVPPANEALVARVDSEIIAPTFRGMKAEGLSYRGVLFFGIMVTAEGPKLLEYNVRFGDPETQSLFELLETDAVDLFESAAIGRLEGREPRFASGASVGVVVAAPGYPNAYPKGLPVRLPEPRRGCSVYHASTVMDTKGRLLTGGGRCFTAVATREDFFTARDAAYALAKEIRFEGAWFRTDIGRKYYGEG